MKPSASPAPSQLSLFDAEPQPERSLPEAPREDGIQTPPPPVTPSRSQSRSAGESAAAALLTTQEAAEFLHVHPRTIQRLVERGELAAVHVGSAVRFERTDLVELTARLKSRASGSPTARTEVTTGRGRAPVSFAERLRSQRDEHRAA
jgi:excisionase family DNA binding protein